ncbi:MAG: 50S ribosomal protein L21 [Planctomycetota bacterium]|jgi:large subunit ribosomal protein L21|nr:50S ribosomal protein L21 [Planctomycetota bacterium]
MYAIVKDRSRCLTLQPGEELWIDRMPTAEPGSDLIFDQVQFLKKEDGSMEVGTPLVKGATVVAEIVGNVKDKKLFVATFKRRKNSRKRTGHRQGYTHIRIKEIRG